MTPALKPAALSNFDLAGLACSANYYSACHLQHHSNIPHQLLQRCMCSPVCQPFLLLELLAQRLELAQLHKNIALHEAVTARLAEVLAGTSNQVWGVPLLKFKSA